MFHFIRAKIAGTGQNREWTNRQEKIHSELKKTLQ
jgi:hypothetical protein